MRGVRVAIRRRGGATAVVAGLIVLPGVLAQPAEAAPAGRALSGSGGAVRQPPGSNGTIEIDGDPLGDGRGNEPHVPCSFAVVFSGFDRGSRNAVVTFTAQPPSGRYEVVNASSGRHLVAFTSDGHPGTAAWSERYTLDRAGLLEQRSAGFHIRVEVTVDGSRATGRKSKVFWVRPCTTAVSTAGAATPPAQARRTPEGSGSTPTQERTSQRGDSAPGHAPASPGPGADGQSSVLSHPPDPLPFTGANVVWAAAAGLGAVIAGAVLLFAGGRRQLLTLSAVRSRLPKLGRRSGARHAS